MPIKALILVMVIFHTSLKCILLQVEESEELRWTFQLSTQLKSAFDGSVHHTRSLQITSLTQINLGSVDLALFTKVPRWKGDWGQEPFDLIQARLCRIQERDRTDRETSSQESCEDNGLIASREKKSGSSLSTCLIKALMPDPSKRHLLDRSRQHYIIVGITWGLLYLLGDYLLEVIQRNHIAHNVSVVGQ